MFAHLRAWAGALCLGLVAATAGLPAAAAPDPQSSRYLHTEGRLLRDRLGHVAQLRGVNLGGWLVTEGWMNGQVDSPSRWALEELEARFGAQRAAQLMAIWQDRWITSADLDLLQRNGDTLLRVPFSWRTLQDATGHWLRDRAGNIDFGRLDWIVSQAAARNMYVVLDLHVWQGQRQDYSQISRLDAGGDSARKQAAALWSEVARHFRGVGTVAAFDLANEPTGSPGDTLQTVLYDAVRAQDPERVVILQSVDYAGLAHRPWRNFIWAAHYPVTATGGDPELQMRAWDGATGIDLHPEIQVPVFIGEMKAPQDNAYSAAALVTALDQRHYGWAAWTYKGVNVGGWAGFNYDSSLRYDLARDSEARIAAQWRLLTAWQDATQPPRASLNGWWFEAFR